MSWHFSRALEAAYLQGTCLGGELSALWKSTPIAHDDYSSDKMKGTYHRSPFGMMFLPSTDGRGEELLTWFREVSRAKISQLQVQEKDLKANSQSCTGNYIALFEKSSLNMYSLKMCQQSLLMEELLSLNRLDQSGIWDHTGYVALGRLGHRTKGIVCGLLPTPRTSQDYKPIRREIPSEMKGAHGRSLVAAIGKLYPNLIGQYLDPQYLDWLMGFPIGWSGPDQLAMPKFQQWQRSHFKSYQKG